MAAWSWPVSGGAVGAARERQREKVEKDEEGETKRPWWQSSVWALAAEEGDEGED